jgi:hypothetical protein
MIACCAVRLSSEALRSGRPPAFQVARGAARLVTLGRPRFWRRDCRLFGQTRVGSSLLSKTVISRASLELCFISVRSAVSLRARPARE